MMLGLVEPQSSGLGGGVFIVHRDAVTGRVATIDGRETAPASATPAYGLGEDEEPIGKWKAADGGRSVGVPGTPLAFGAGSAGA